MTNLNPLPSAEDCQLAISSRQEGSCHDTELCALEPRRVSGSRLTARSCRRRCSRPRHPKHRCALSASQCQGPREFPLLRRRKFSIALTADRCSRSKGQGMLRHATVKHLSSTEGPHRRNCRVIRNLNIGHSSRSQMTSQEERISGALPNILLNPSWGCPFDGE